MESLSNQSALQKGCLVIALVLLVALLYFILYNDNMNALWSGLGLLLVGGVYAWECKDHVGGSRFHYGGYGSGSSSSSSSDSDESLGDGGAEGGAAKKAKKAAKKVKKAKKAKKAAKKAVKKAAKKAAK